MSDVIRNNAWVVDVQVASIDDRIMLIGVSLLGIALLAKMHHLGEPFANGLIVDCSSVEMVFDAIDSQGLNTFTVG